MAKSTIFSAAAAVMALSGAASAAGSYSNGSFPLSLNSTKPYPLNTNSTGPFGSGPGYNATTMPHHQSSTSSSSSAMASATSTSKDPKFCPALDGQIFLGPLEIDFAIGCGVNHVGIVIDIELQKRATPTSLQDCINECAPLDECVGTSFNTNTQQCTLFSSVGAEYNEAGAEFARKTTAAANSTSSASAPYPTGMFSNSTMTNSTRPATNGTAPSNSTRSPMEDLFCPMLDGQIYVDGYDVDYIIECSRNHVGVVIDIQSAKVKRQAAAQTSLLDCMDLCDQSAACVGTAFNSASNTCTLFSSVGAAYYDANVDFALRVAPATTVSAGAQLTSTIYSTNVQTISSCAPTVTNCPLRGGVVTDVIAVSETVYQCPSETTMPAAPIACTNCPYAAITATVYSTTVQTISSCAPTVTNCPLNAAGNNAGNNAAGAASGASTVTVTTVVAVQTSVVNYPLPTGTVASTLSGASKTGSATTSTGLVQFTGAASHLNAGMGMAAVAVAGAVFMI